MLLLILIWYIKSEQLKITYKEYIKENPMFLAVEYYKSPLPTFEAIVKDNIDFLTNNYKYSFPDESLNSPSILSSCALYGLTGHIEVLLKYNVDTNEAISWLKKENEDEALNLLLTLINSKTNNLTNIVSKKNEHKLKH